MITEYQIWLISSIAQHGHAFVAEPGRSDLPSTGYQVTDRGEQSVLRNLEKLGLIEKRDARFSLTPTGQWVYENQDTMNIRRSY